MILPLFGGRWPQDVPAGSKKGEPREGRKPVKTGWADYFWVDLVCDSSGDLRRQWETCFSEFAHPGAEEMGLFFHQTSLILRVASIDSPPHSFWLLIFCLMDCLLERSRRWVGFLPRLGQSKPKTTSTEVEEVNWVHREEDGAGIH